MELMNCRVTTFLVLLFELFSIKSVVSVVNDAIYTTTMLRPRQILYSIALLMLVATSACAQAEVKADAILPDWLNAKIAKLEAPSKYEQSPEIWKILYKNEDAYLFIAPCCDQFDALYDATGKLLCYPRGGFSGGGDGKCLDAITPMTKYVVVWKKPESSKK